MVGAGVHVSIRNTKVFSDICSDPISWVLMVHWDYVRLVLSWAWHVKVLRPRVKLHAEGELCFLLASGIIRVSRIREIEVTWDVVLWAWYSHELYLVALFLLDVSDLGSGLGAVINSWAFTALGSHAEWRTLLSMRDMNWVVCAWA